MLAVTSHPLSGMGFTSPSVTSMPPALVPSTEFGQLVTLYQSNQVLLNELDSLKVKRERTREYLETSPRNPALALAHVNRLRAKHSAVLVLLRANRFQVRALLGPCQGGHSDSAGPPA
jgi:hypothetical protein